MRQTASDDGSWLSHTLPNQNINSTVLVSVEMTTPVISALRLDRERESIYLLWWRRDFERGVRTQNDLPTTDNVVARITDAVCASCVCHTAHLVRVLLFGCYVDGLLIGRQHRIAANTVYAMVRYVQ